MRLGVALAVGVLCLSACSSELDAAESLGDVGAGAPGLDDPSGGDGDGTGSGRSGSGLPITIAFAGDVHFEGFLAEVPDRPRSTLGEMSQRLRSADLAVANLESPVTTRGSLASKELEDSGNRFWFRSAPAALDVLDRSGIDVVSVANNHGGDYGIRGLLDTIDAAADHPVSVVGIGRDSREAFTPYRENVRGNDVAVFAADSSFRESRDPIWGVLPDSGPGMASARVPYTRQLTSAVEKAAAVDDVVVVYLHWGDEGASCPTRDQRTLAVELADAGADIVVGAHTHVPVGSGLIDDTYVNYGLGNFYWYNGSRTDTGVLEITIEDGAVVQDKWRPAEIPDFGGPPTALEGPAAKRAIGEWRDLRDCTILDPGPTEASAAETPEPEQPQQPERPRRDALPAYSSSIGRIGTALRERMTGVSYDPATCPVGLEDLRRLSLSYVDFNGDPQTGAMVVHRDVARDVVGVFERLYDARFRIRQMVVVDVYGGDDDASMAANNTSAYNCRNVAGTDSFSDHAFGRAIDINPVQNPYVLPDGILPPSGARFVDVDRSPGARTTRGVIGAGSVVTRAFADIGWQWGADFSSPDYQHFFQ